MYTPIQELPTDIRDFVNCTLTQINRRRIKTLLPLTPRVYFAPNMQTSGYFSAEEFAVGMGKSLNEWLRIFAHESSHADQLFEDARVWRFRVKNKDPCQLLDLWLQGRKYAHDVIEKFISCIIELERDCEIRTMRKIRDHNLPLDIEDYCRRANVYMCFYRAVQSKRRWYKQDLYTPELLDTVRSDRIMFMSELSKITIKQQKLFYSVMDK